MPNGEARFRVAGGADIDILLHSGHDVLRVGSRSDNVNPPDDLVIDMADGNDEVRIVGDVNVHDDLDINTRAGNDVV